jgi:prepilin signal peptidase PulO-like enzyme (type II secretory pathway)
MVRMGGLLGGKNSMMVIHDFTLLLYALNILFGVYGFFLFGWWALKKGGASAWYLYVMLFLLGVVISTIPEFISRSARLMDDLDRVIYIGKTHWWAWRKLPLTIALALMAIHATVKLIRNHNE